MALLALTVSVAALWVGLGLRVAYRLEPKVTKLALMVLGSAVLWPLTLHSSRASRVTTAPTATAGRPSSDRSADNAHPDKVKRPS